MSESGLYSYETDNYIRGQVSSEHEHQLCVAQVLFDDAWQWFLLELDTYCRMVFPECADAEAQAHRERIYSNRLGVAAQLVSLRYSKLARLEQ